MVCLFVCETTADITTPGRSRAIRISIVEGSVAVTMALTTLGIGIWIKDGNYKHPLIFCVACTILAIIFTVFILPETSKQPEHHRNVQ
jgi:hypothetical protein